MSRPTLPALVLALALPGAAAAAPQLAFHVTDENVDVFVGLFDGMAVELAGCANAVEARALLELAPGAEAVGSTLADLEAEFGYGTHPRIPCAAASFDIDWPATTPIWADVQGSGLYYLPAPAGRSGFYAVPSRCTALRSALAIRERLQLPGVLQGLMLPPDPGAPVILDCGDSTAGEPTTGGGPAAPAEWSLHRFDTFLSELSTGDTIWVARYTPPGEGAAPAYLPVWRIDGRETSALILDGGREAEQAEAALRALLSIPPAAVVSPLGAEAVSAIRSAVFADICTADCPGYAWRHAAFADPALDLGLSDLPAVVAESRTDRLGASQLVWAFLHGRAAIFTGCDRLAAAMGLSAPDAGDWATAVEAGLAGPVAGGFDCRAGGPDTCIRRLADGQPLGAADFAPGADCPGARHLRLELPARVRTTGPLALTGPGFASVALLPAPGVARSLVTATPGVVGAGGSRCILSSAESLIVASGLPRLELHRIDLARAAGTGAGEVVALQVQAGTVALDDVGVGREGEGLAAVGRGVDLCLADLYAADSRIEATSLAVQGTAARLLVTGGATTRATFARARVGLLLSADSRARLDRLDVRAANPVVLRGATVTATATSLEPPGDSPASGSAAMLERGSSLAMTTSTARGFRCAVSFADAASRASFVLPGNDLARDNTHLACGGGQFSLIE